ncbi:MAG: hypothetical protein ACMUJM_22055 [bacterium]
MSLKNKELVKIVRDAIGHYHPIATPVYKNRYEKDGPLILIYMDKSKRIKKHVANTTSQKIYELCDGHHSLIDISQILGRCYPEATDDELFETVVYNVRLFEKKEIIFFQKGS